MNQSDYFEIEIKDGICTVWLENKLGGMNVVSPTLIDIMKDSFESYMNDPEIKGIIIISRLKDFMAGADIKSFEIEKKGEFRPIQALGHQILAKIENSDKPIVAAIHGTAYGLGVELPLACHAIIVTDDPSTKMALPEVKLGILPGGGGTQRLPRRVGIQAALDMMLTGKNIYAHQARKMGLADAVVNKNKLHYAAVKMVEQLASGKPRKERKQSFADKALEGNAAGRSILFNQARKVAKKQSKGNYPAVPAIIDCVETGYSEGIEAGYAKELELFEGLLLSKESKGLRNLFYIMTDNKKREKPSKPLNKLGMIGAGFMGSGITEVSVKNDIDVILKDIAYDGIAATQKAIWKGLQKKVKYKTLSKLDAERTIGRIQGQLSYEDFDEVDIVIEAVLEKMDLKKKIIEDIEKHCKDDVVIATNTSALSVTEMAEHAKRSEQVIGMHYFSPVPKMPLLEIVKTKYTSDEVIKQCYDFGVRQGKTVIVVNDCPGFYVNRILIPYLNECLLMVDEGVSIEVINTAMEDLGFPVGPFKLIDEVGIDVSAHVSETGIKHAGSRPDFPVNLSIMQMYKDGLTGKKGRRGFFTYDAKGKRKGVNKSIYKYFKGDGDVEMKKKEIQQRALCMMLNEALMCLDEGIIADETAGNTGAVFGIGFLPFTGGPFQYMRTQGYEKMARRFAKLEAKYGSRFKMAATPVPVMDTAMEE